MAYVWLHYIYEPFRFRRKTQNVHQLLSKRSSSHDTIEIEERVRHAGSQPFRAKLPEDARSFVEPGETLKAARLPELRRGLPEKRVALREALSDWQDALNGTSSKWRNRLQRRWFSRAPLRVRRGAIFDSAAEGFLAAERTQLLSGVHVQFFAEDGTAELGVDSGGLSREFFTCALRDLTGTDAPAPGQGMQTENSDDDLPMGHSSSINGHGETMFREQENCALMLTTSSRPLAVYYALGRMFATALVHASFGDVALPMVLNDCLLKYIVGQPITAVDVRQRDPIYYESRINSLLKPLGIQQMAEILCVDTLTFEENGVELVEFGSSIEVTVQNVEEYVKLLSEEYVCGKVRKELAQVLAGFHDIVPKDVLARCDIGFADLGMLLSGVPSLDVEEWREHTIINANHIEKDAAQRTISWLWKVLSDLVHDDRALVLAFATGCSRLPAVGFAGLDPNFTVYLVGTNSDQRLPTSHTCANSLAIPLYTSFKEFACKFIFAIREGAGSFDLR